MKARSLIFGLLLLVSLSARGWIVYFDATSTNNVTFQIRYTSEDEEKNFETKYLKGSEGVYKCTSRDVNVVPSVSEVRYSYSGGTTPFLPFEPGVVYYYVAGSYTFSPSVKWYAKLSGCKTDGYKEMIKEEEGNGIYKITFIPESTSISIFTAVGRYYDITDYDFYDFYYGKPTNGNLTDLELVNSETEPKVSDTTLTGFEPGKEYTLIWDTYNEKITVTTESNTNDVRLSWLTAGVETDENGNFIFTGTNRVNNVITLGAEEELTEEMISSLQHKIEYVAPNSLETSDVTGLDNSIYDIINNRQFILKKAGVYTITTTLPL